MPLIWELLLFLKLISQNDINYNFYFEVNPPHMYKRQHWIYHCQITSESQICCSLKHNTTTFLMGFQCYFGVLVTTNLISYYKAVSSIELCKTSLGSWKVHREWAWFNTPLRWSHTGKCSKYSGFFDECLCLRLNLKCMSRTRQSLQSELRSVTVEWPCAAAIKWPSAMTLIKSSFKSCCYEYF